MSDPVTTQPAICLNMIVHNDAHMREDGHIIQETLDSVAPFINSWVIVDAGSDDGTQDLVRNHMAHLGIPGTLFERPWRSAGQIATEAIDLAQGRGDFIWVVDVDEVLVGAVDFGRLSADAYALRHQMADEIVWRTRLFRNGLRWRFDGIVLATPTYDHPYDAERLHGRYRVEHRHRGDPTRGRPHYTHNSEPLLAAVERDPQDVASSMLLAENYFFEEDFGRAREWYARRIAVGGLSPTEDSYLALYRLAVSMHQLGEPWPQVQDAYLRAWEFRPTRAEPLYAIACRLRHDKQYGPGYEFAKRAASIPWPDDDRLIPEPSVYTWRAIDEQAVCASWIGKPHEAFALCRDLIARADLPDADRLRILSNRDFSVPAMIEATSHHPFTPTGGLLRGTLDAQVTATLFAGPDLAPTVSALDSFLNCCVDLARVGRFLAVDIGLSPHDRKSLQAAYPFVELISSDPGEAHNAGLDRVRAHVGGRFWLHLGQGWHFFAPENLITRLTAVLEAETLVVQVGVNFADARQLSGLGAVEQAVRRAPGAGRYVLTDELATGPAMFDTARLDLIGGVNPTVAEPIAELSRRAASAGLRAASLDEVLCIGRSAGDDGRVEAVFAPAAAQRTMHRFCVTHMEPLIPRTWYDDCIALGEYQPDSACHVSRLDQFWHRARPLAYGAAGSYALPAAIERFAGDADLIEISMYRKKILLSPEGKPGAHPRSRELSVDECIERTDLSSPIAPPSDSGFLISQPLYVDDGLMGLYAGYHPFRDLLDYTSLAIELGLLDHRSAVEFFNGKLVIPGGTEFGIFPASWLLTTLPKLEQVSREFLQRFGKRVETYDAFQVRAVGFLSECLGSFLLVRHLSERYSNNIPADVFGYMTCVTEEGLSYHAGVAG